MYTNALNCLVENPEQPNVEWPVPVSPDAGASGDGPELESEPDVSRTPFPPFRIRWRSTTCWRSWRRLGIHSPSGSWRKRSRSAFIPYDVDYLPPLFVDPADHRVRRDGSSTAYKERKVIVLQTRSLFRNPCRTLGMGPNEAPFRQRHTLFGASTTYRVVY